MKDGRKIDQSIARKLKYYRRYQGVTQAQLAQKLGCTFQLIQKYENGLSRISVGRLCRIAAALHVPVSAFFDENIRTPWQPDPLLEALVKLPQNKRAFLLSMAQQIKEL